MAAELLKAQGITPWQEPKLIGITEIETQLKLKKLKLEDVLGKIVESKPGKPALVSAADKREALSPTAAAVEDFK